MLIRYQLDKLDLQVQPIMPLSALTKGNDLIDNLVAQAHFEVVSFSINVHRCSELIVSIVPAEIRLSIEVDQIYLEDRIHRCVCISIALSLMFCSCSSTVMVPL